MYILGVNQCSFGCKPGNHDRVGKRILRAHSDCFFQDERPFSHKALPCYDLDGQLGIRWHCMHQILRGLHSRLCQFQDFQALLLQNVYGHYHIRSLSWLCVFARIHEAHLRLL